MFKVAELSAEQRNELFSETADAMNLHPAIVEKDFWVCLVLHILFTSKLADKMVFKGGTSLSKVFGVIRRFSEDIDLILDWSLLGFDSSKEENDPWHLRSKTKQDIFNKNLNEKATGYIETALTPLLNSLFKEKVPTVCELKAEIDPADKHTIRVFYSKSFSESYIRPEIRLEIGPLASWIPQDTFPIESYAEEKFPHLFSEKVSVCAIKAERTFWEKCTILHQEANRPENKPFPRRYSRHYYDIYMMAQSEIKERAFAYRELLPDVAEFKTKFYPCGWAKYDEATLSQLKLNIPKYNLEPLREDYRQMQEMLFGDVPTFEELISSIIELETEIHLLA